MQFNEEQIEVFGDFLTKKGFHVKNKNGSVQVLDGYGHRINDNKISALWKSTKEYNDKYFPVDIEDLPGLYSSFTEEAQGPDSEDGKMSDAEKILVFLERFYKEYEFRLDKSAFILFRKGVSRDKQVMIKTAATNTRLYLMADNVPVLPLETCISLVELQLAEKTENIQEESIDAIRYDPTIKERFSFKRWTQKLFSFYGIQDTKLNRVMWKYFMHGIKRAVYGRCPAEERIFFLVFSRTQGIGKSRLLRHMCDPFPFAFNESVSLSMFMDRTAIKAFANGEYALADFQELGLGSKNSSSISPSDLATTMKAIITMDVFKSRELFTTNDTSAKLTTVFASSTNLHISDVIKDEQYRRYFTFNSTLTREEALKRDWSEVDEFFKNTIYDAYRFLNEDELPSLDDEMSLALREEQLTYKRRTDLITQWMDDSGLKLCEFELFEQDREKYALIEFNSVYQRFAQFLSKNGYSRHSSARMQQLIASSIDILPGKGEDGRMYYCIERGDGKIPGFRPTMI